MANKTQIEWTNATWNVFTGCDKVSPGCANCYAERYAKRLQRMGVRKYSSGFDLTFHPEVMDYPLKLPRPRLIFVNSMSDLFHENIDFELIDRIFQTMKEADWHTYQILTKRSARLAKYAEHYGNFPNNIWIGVSVESSKYKSRISDLKKVRSKTHFLSLEPLLGPLGDLNLDDIEWVIAGGESGPRFHECKIEWVRHIRDQCIKAKVPFFFKQWGGLTSKSGGRTLDRKIWNQYPSLGAQRLESYLTN